MAVGKKEKKKTTETAVQVLAQTEVLVHVSGPSDRLRSKTVGPLVANLHARNLVTKSRKRRTEHSREQRCKCRQIRRSPRQIANKMSRLCYTGLNFHFITISRVDKTQRIKHRKSQGLGPENIKLDYPRN